MTVKQGNMCLALGGPGVVAMDCQEAAAVGAGSFFPVAVPKYDPQAAAGVHSTRQACPSKRCKAEQALGHVKFAHAEAYQSKFGKRQASDFRSGILFQSAVGGTRAPGVADKIGVQFGVAHSQLSLLIGESAKVLDAVRKAAN